MPLRSKLSSDTPQGLHTWDSESEPVAIGGARTRWVGASPGEVRSAPGKTRETVTIRSLAVRASACYSKAADQVARLLAAADTISWSASFAIIETKGWTCAADQGKASGCRGRGRVEHTLGLLRRAQLLVVSVRENCSSSPHSPG